ncbi:MAG: hypothetical protein ACREYC_25345 [Gammaproteobacteria bacterium]
MSKNALLAHKKAFLRTWWGPVGRWCRVAEGAIGQNPTPHPANALAMGGGTA